MLPAAAVTGGGRGLGRVVAARLSREFPVVVVGRSRACLDSFVTEAGRARADLVEGDVRDAGTAAAVASLAASRGWAIDHVVCNAGIGRGGPVLATPATAVADTLDTNFMGCVHFVKQFLPGMVERRQGSIALIGSIAGLRAAKNDAAYSASKAALAAWGRSLGLETRKHGVYVRVLCPGYVEGEMTDRVIATRARFRGAPVAAIRAELEAASPDGRILPADAVARAVADVCGTRDLSQSGQPLLFGEHWELDRAAALDSEPPWALSEHELDALVGRLERWARAHLGGARLLYVPVSGGSDSALAMWLCGRAGIPAVVGLHFGRALQPDCRAFFERQAGCSVRLLSTPDAGGAIDADTARWAAAHSLALRDRAWLVGSRTKTEAVMGTFSVASRLALLQPLQGLWKGVVMQLAAHVGVPAAVLASSRAADPACGRPAALAEVGLEAIDHFARCVHTGREDLLAAGGSASGGGGRISAAQVAYLRGIYEYNAFKREQAG